jgi:hypothetical protein
VVECDLAKVEVAGSNPVSRSKANTFNLPAARYPSGKGEVCKTFMRRFDSAPRLQDSQNVSMSLTLSAQGHCSGNCSDPRSICSYCEILWPATYPSIFCIAAALCSSTGWA